MVDSSASLCELGRLHYEKGELNAAEPYLIEARHFFLTRNKIRSYFDVSYRLLRIYLEKEDFDKVSKLKSELQELILREDVEMSSRLYYTLGVCAEVEGGSDKALKFFEEALNAALTESNKEDMCYALCGKMIWYKNRGDLKTAFSIGENIRLFLESLEIPEVATSLYLIESDIYFKQDNLDESLDSLWKAYETSKRTKSLPFMSAYIFIQFSNVLFKMGKVEMAKTYYMMAEKSIREDEHKRTKRMLLSLKEMFETETRKTPDILIRRKDHTIWEISKGEIPVNNQFILIELLGEFVKKQGHTLTKDDLAQFVWDQDYDPTQHDNKIYVTIRRLRKLLEPNPKRPTYILRSKEGYTLNQDANVVITD